MLVAIIENMQREDLNPIEKPMIKPDDYDIRPDAGRNFKERR
jgi:hypothetical protein